MESFEKFDAHECVGWSRAKVRSVVGNDETGSYDMNSISGTRQYENRKGPT